MEDTIQSIRPISPTANDINFPKKTVVALEFESISRPYQKEKIFNRLQKVSLIDFDVRVDDVHIDEEGKYVAIFIILENRISFPNIFNYFIKVLSEYGFTKVSVMNLNQLTARLK